MRAVAERRERARQNDAGLRRQPRRDVQQRHVPQRTVRRLGAALAFTALDQREGAHGDGQRFDGVLRDAGHPLRAVGTVGQRVGGVPVSGLDQHQRLLREAHDIGRVDPAGARDLSSVRQRRASGFEVAVQHLQRADEDLRDAAPRIALRQRGPGGLRVGNDLGPPGQPQRRTERHAQPAQRRAIGKDAVLITAEDDGERVARRADVTFVHRGPPDREGGVRIGRHVRVAEPRVPALQRLRASARQAPRHELLHEVRGGCAVATGDGVPDRAFPVLAVAVDRGGASMEPAFQHRVRAQFVLEHLPEEPMNVEGVTAGVERGDEQVVVGERPQPLVAVAGLEHRVADVGSQLVEDRRADEELALVRRRAQEDLLAEVLGERRRVRSRRGALIRRVAVA